MWSAGLLFAELARETEGGMIDRIYPFFLAVTAVFAIVVAIMALRRRPDQTDRRERQNE